MRKKLKIGNIVRVNFLGSNYVHKDKKSVWFIEAFISDTPGAKSTRSIDTRKKTTKKSELDQAIEKQKDFIKGNIKK